MRTMKKLYYILVSMLVAAVLAVGCTEDITKDEMFNGPEEGVVKTEFMEVTAALEVNKAAEGEDSRTVLFDNGNGGKIVWDENDVIAAVSADGTITKCTATSVNGSAAVFSVPTDTKYALYPHIGDAAKQKYADGKLTHTLYATHSLDGSNKVFNKNQNSMVAELSNNNLKFYNICGFVEIKLKGSEKVTHIALRNNLHDWKPITGTGTIDMTDPTNPVFTGVTDHGKAYHWVKATADVQLNNETATPFYLIVAPGTYENLSICVTTDKGSYQIQSKNSITINRAKIRPFTTINLDNLKPQTTTNLSEKGVANCYVVPQGAAAKTYSFPARKINATEVLENASYAHLMWSEQEQMITNVCYDAQSGTVSFKYEGNNLEGNALISVLDKDNKILWSWHIWCTDEPQQLVICGTNKNYGILDRNLGATYTPKTPAEAASISASNATDAAGLYYQYGRPTPFPRVKDIKTYSESSCFDSARVELQYGFASYVQKFAWNGTNRYTQSAALTYPNYFYTVRYSNAAASAEATSGTNHTYYAPAYNAYSEAENLWYSEDADVVSKKATLDPCPPGYVMDETAGVNGYLKNVYTETAWGDTTKDTYGYYYQCPNTEDLVYVPTAGYRAGDSAKLGYCGRNFNLWAVQTTTAHPDNKLQAVRISSNNNCPDTMTPTVSEEYAQLGQGFAVRCRAIDRSDLQGKTYIKTTFEGQGTAASPYLIKTSGDLVKLAGLCNGTLVATDGVDYSSAHYALTTSINMLNVVITPITPFKGTFDGKDNTISNLKVTPSNGTPTGMFGELEGATVKNLNLSSVAVFVTETSQLYTGGIAGKATDSTISKVKVEGSISSAAAASFDAMITSYKGSSAVTGGVVGYSINTTISDAVFNGLVTTTKGQYIGGIVAALQGGSVTRATFERGSNISTTMNHVGGIVGTMWQDAVVSDCTVDTPISSKHAFLGGIAGRMVSGKISNCLVSSDSCIESHKSNPESYDYYGVGGIVGVIQLVAGHGSVATVEKCANYADVSGNCYVGGLVGNIHGSTTGVNTINVTIKESVFCGSLHNEYKNNYNYGLSGGIIGCSNQSNSKSGQTKVTDCVALIDGFTFNSVATSAGFGGVVGYTKTTDYVRCYTNLEVANMISEEGKDISTYGTGKYYGVLHGRTSGAATANNNNFTNVYYLTGQKKGQEAATSEVEVEEVSASQMTDGTLLGKLNGAGGSWKASASGYPVPTNAPVDIAAPSTVAKTRVSIIGDSISTFEGWMPSGYKTYYPLANPTVISASQTYWYKLIYKYMSNATLEKNIAWSGTVVARSTDANYLATDHGAGHCFVERFRDDGMGNPDVILLHGGTNDVSNRGKSISLYPGYPIYGASGYDNSKVPTDAEMSAVYARADAATTWDQLLALNDTTFVEAYVKLLSMMHNKHPQAKVVMIIGDWIHQGTRGAILKIAQHYGTKYGYVCVDLQEISPQGSYNVIPKENGCHPNEAGFEVMANYIYEKAGSYIDPKN